MLIDIFFITLSAGALISAINIYNLRKDLRALRDENAEIWDSIRSNDAAVSKRISRLIESNRAEFSEIRGELGILKHVDTYLLNEIDSLGDELDSYIIDIGEDLERAQEELTSLAGIAGETAGKQDEKIGEVSEELGLINEEISSLTRLVRDLEGKQPIDTLSVPGVVDGKRKAKRS